MLTPFDVYVTGALIAGAASVFLFAVAVYQLRDDDAVNRGKLSEAMSKTTGDMMDAFAEQFHGELRALDSRVLQQGIAWSRRQADQDKLIESRSIASQERDSKLDKNIADGFTAVRREMAEHVLTRHRALKSKNPRRKR